MCGRCAVLLVIFLDYLCVEGKFMNVYLSVVLGGCRCVRVCEPEHRPCVCQWVNEHPNVWACELSGGVRFCECVDGTL